MIFEETKIEGLFVIEPELISDERGFFACSWSSSEFENRGLSSHVVQCNISFNHQRGTVRGMHYQREPHQEVKLVRCTRGAIFDVAVDLRADSATRYQWVGAELTAENRRMFYIPKGFAHGYITLTDETEILYQMSEYYHPESAAGLRWNDPALGIGWPANPEIIDPRDAAWPLINRR